MMHEKINFIDASFPIINSSVIREKDESQNGCCKKTKRQIFRKTNISYLLIHKLLPFWRQITISYILNSFEIFARTNFCKSLAPSRFNIIYFPMVKNLPNILTDSKQLYYSTQFILEISSFTYPTIRKFKLNAGSLRLKYHATFRMLK